MKINRKLVFLILALTLWVIQGINAQWKQAAGPSGGYVKCFSVKDSILFVKNELGYKRSIDGGTTWVPLQSDINYLYCFTSKGTTIIAGTVGGVYTSDNNGETFVKAANNGMVSGATVNSLVVTGDNLFAGTTSGVYLSTNNGENWTAVNTGLTNTNITSLTIKDSYVIAGSLGISPDYLGKISRSSDYGSTWEIIDTGLPIKKDIITLIAKDTNIFAAVYDYDYSQVGTCLYYSSDIGINWTRILSINDISSFAIKDTLLLVGKDDYRGSGGMSRSSDNGKTWTTITPGLVNADVNSIGVINGNIFAGTSGGLYKTVDNGNNWTDKSEGFGVSSLNCLLISEGSIFAGTENSGTFLSNDNGASWSSINSGLQGSTIYTLFENQGVIFSGTSGGGYDIFDNPGWTNYQISGLYGSVRTMEVNGSNLFAGTNAGGVLLSTNNGIDWVKKYSGLPYSTTVNSIVAFDTIVYIVAGGSSYYSTDTANSWHGFLVDNTYAISAFFKEGDILYGSASQKQFRSTDNGKTWEQIEIGGNYGISAMASKDSIIFASVTYKGVFVSIDNGLTWQQGSEFPDNVEFHTIKINGDVIYAGTNKGLYWATLKSIIPPKAPEGLQIVDSLNKSITIKWKQNNEADFMRYRIYVDTLPNPSTLYDSTTMGSTDTIKIITGLNDRTKYYISITAVDSFYCESFQSNQATATIIDTLVPTTPQGLVITDDFVNNFTLKWNKNPEADILRYRIYMGLSPESLQLVDSTTSGVNDTATIFQNLWAEHLYYFAISAVDLSLHESPVSAIITDTASHIINVTYNHEMFFGNTKLSEYYDGEIYYQFSSNANPDTLRIYNVISTDSNFIVLDSTAEVTNFYSGNYINIRFSPTKIGSIQGDIIVSSNAITKIDTIHVSGFGYGEGILSCVKTIDFGQVMINQPIDTIIELANTGNDTLKIPGINYDNVLRLIPPGEYINYTFTLHPDQLGVISSKIMIHINNYETMDSIMISGYVYGIGVLNVEPTTIDFGELNLGTSLGKGFTMTNTGTDTIKISNIESTNTFFDEIDYLAAIAPNQFYNAAITFNASLIGSVSGKLIITSNSPLIYDTIYLTAFVKGKADIESNVSSINYGDVPENTLKDTTFTLTNIGTDTLFIEQFSFNTNTVDGIMTVLPANMIIPMGLSQEFTLRFTPDEVRNWEAGLYVHSNAPISPFYIIDISGNSIINSIHQLDSRSIFIQSYPNPFDQSITLEYYVPGPSNVNFNIYDLTGKKIATWEELGKDAGLHQYIWGGKDSNGIVVDKGIFLLQVVVYEIKGNRPLFKGKSLLMKQ